MYDTTTASPAPYEPDDMDLAQFDDDWAQAPVEEPAFEPVPDGNYQVSVDSVELTRSKSANNPMLKWRLQVLAPSHVGRILWRNNLIVTRENIRWLKKDLAVCGLTLEKLSDLPARLEELLDIKIEVTKRTQGDFENVYLNRRIVLDGQAAGAYPDDDIPF